VARPTLYAHRKFRRLARALKSEALAAGHLELLWHSAYESGDDWIGDGDDVEAAARWTGRKGVLTSALLTAGGDEDPGFIEPDLRGGYRVHDLWDHAPEYVRKRRTRELARRETGKALSARNSDASVRTVSGQSPPDGGHRPPNGKTPTPTRSTVRTPSTSSSPLRRRRHRQDDDDAALSGSLRGEILARFGQLLSIEPTARDRALASRLARHGVPVDTIEAAILTGLLRKGSDPDRPRSLGYFAGIVEELQRDLKPDQIQTYLDARREDWRSVASKPEDFPEIPIAEGAEISR